MLPFETCGTETCLGGDPKRYPTPLETELGTAVGSKSG